MLSTSTWALLPVLLSTFVQALPMPAQVPFGLDLASSLSSSSPLVHDFARLARLTSSHRCSSHPTINHPIPLDSSFPRTITYVQPYPLESISAGVELLSSASPATELVPLRSKFLSDVPEDVLVMRVVRDRFEEEAEAVLFLVDRSRTEETVSSGESDVAVVELVGSALAGPVALLHALHLNHVWSDMSPRPRIAVTLFSSPRFGNEAFSTYVTSLTSSHFSLDTVTSPLDALPLLPSRGSKQSGFRDLHAGNKWEMRQGGKLVVPWSSGLMAMLRRERQRWTAVATGAQGWEDQFARDCPAVSTA